MSASCEREAQRQRRVGQRDGETERRREELEDFMLLSSVFLSADPTILSCLRQEEADGTTVATLLHNH